MLNITNKLGVITIAIFSIILLAGYSLTPSVFEGRKILSKQIEKQSGGVIKLVKFEKSNRQKVVWLGAKIYSMEYDAEIEFLDDCYWGGPACGFEIVKGKPVPFTAFMFEGKREAKKGQHVKVMGKLQFEKTENGWRGQIVGNSQKRQEEIVSMNNKLQ